MMGSSNAIAAKAKAMYAKRLTDEDYRALLKKGSVSEVAAYLKTETDYATVLANVKESLIHRGQLEELLNRDLFYKEIRLLAYASPKKREFYQTCVRKIEIQQILMKIRQISSPLYSEMFSVQQFSHRELCYDQKKLEQASTYKEVVELLAKTPYAQIVTIDRIEGHETVDYVSLEKAMNDFYDELMISNIEKYLRGKEKKEALTIYLTAIELKMITKIYRLKKYYHANAEAIMKYTNFSHSRMNRKWIEQLIMAENADDVLKLLSKSHYQLYMDDKEYIYIEYYAEKIRYHLAKKVMRFSSSPPLVFMTYTILHQIEIMNLVNIIEGIRYGMSEEQIEKTCII